MTTLNTNVGHVTMQFDFSIDSVPGGPGVKVMAVLRKSKAGSYRVRVRVGRQGRVWLSIAKTRGQATATIIGQPVLIKGWRYRAGQKVTVRAQAIKKDPTQIRVKVWPTGSAPPARWQLVRNDVSADIGGTGRVGLRAQITRRATNPNATVRFDNVTVNRAQDAVPVAVDPDRRQEAAAARQAASEQSDKTEPEDPRDRDERRSRRRRPRFVGSWTSPPRASSSTARPGRTGRTTTVEDSYEHTTHLRNLGPLEPGTTYHFRVVSEDEAGNKTVSREHDVHDSSDRYRPRAIQRRRLPWTRHRGRRTRPPSRQRRRTRPPSRQRRLRETRPRRGSWTYRWLT